MYYDINNADGKLVNSEVCYYFNDFILADINRTSYYSFQPLNDRSSDIRESISLPRFWVLYRKTNDNPLSLHWKLQ